MKVKIQDAKALRSLELTSVASYLKSRHWSLVGKVHGEVPVFEKGEHQVLLPLSQEFADYPERLQEVLRVLAQDEERSELEVFEELVFASADRIRFCLDTSIAKRGTLPINLGVRFFEKARDVIYAAACATVEPKPYYQGRRHQKAEDYMEKVYLGQTERGSFVLNAGASIPPAVNHLLEEDQPPFERRVTETLLSSVRAAKAAAHNVALGACLDPFQEACNKGVSANLCAALADLFLDEDEASLEISAQWSALRPSSKLNSSPVRLEGSLSPIFAEAARSLRERAPREEFVAEGWVVSLRRDTDQERGRTVIYAPIDGAYKKIRVTLEGDDYQLATQAHGDRLPVTVQGELIRGNKGFTLKNPRHFGLTDHNDELEFDFED